MEILLIALLVVAVVVIVAMATRSSGIPFTIDPTLLVLLMILIVLIIGVFSASDLSFSSMANLAWD